MTVSEIAKLAGVSATTVSLCFKENSRISEKTRKKVLKIASEAGYFPNKLAQMLRGQESNLVGIVVSEFDTPFMQDIVTNAEKYLSEAGYKVLIFSTYRDLEKEKEALVQAMEFQACGLIVCACERENEVLSNLSIPVVCVDSVPPKVNSHYIIEDMDSIVRCGLDYLFSLGHEKILFVNGSENEEHFNSFIHFSKAAKKYMREKGLEPGKKYFVNGGIYIKDGYKAVSQALWQDLDFTAVFCISDNVAIGAIDALEEKGRSVPDQVSVLGIDNSEIGKLRRISLTTVSTYYGDNYMHIGEMAADLLLRSVNNKDYPLKKIVMEPKLVVRGSCGKRK